MIPSQYLKSQELFNGNGKVGESIKDKSSSSKHPEVLPFLSLQHEADHNQNLPLTPLHKCAFNIPQIWNFATVFISEDHVQKGFILSALVILKKWLLTQIFCSPLKSVSRSFHWAPSNPFCRGWASSDSPVVKQSLSL